MIQKTNILFISLLFIIAAFVSCSKKTETKVANSKQVVDDSYAEIKFDTTFHDFGTLIEGEKAAFTFRFKNTGNSSLVIKDAYSSCGCTIPSFSNEPIAPGAEGKIDVIFDSEGKKGVQYKTIIIKANTIIEEKSLMIKVNVIESNYKS